MPDSWGFHTQDLLSTAQKYVESGWSVIPLRGDTDPASPKAPAIAWADYQLRRPAPFELEAWFGASKRYVRNALGIVCGAVSSLVVLDFDDAAAAESFALACPDLTNTMTVFSGGRGLPHYYFHVPRGQIAATKRVQGVDFQSSGTYVVAPQSRINGQLWELVVDMQPLTLSRADVMRIYRFMDALVYAQSDLGAGIAASTPYFESQSVTCVTDFGSHEHFINSPSVAPNRHLPAQSVTCVTLSTAAAHRYYQKMAQQAGRNNALFRTALYARDAGWSLVRCLRDLLDVHVMQPMRSQHTPETPDQRRREGLATLRSVFNRPVRPQLTSLSQSHLRTNMLPNALRERFLQLGALGVSVARVLDGLLLVGIQAGQRFTEKLATTLLRPLRIGRRTILGALAAPLQPPVEETSTDIEPDKVVVEEEPKQQIPCVFVRGAKRVKSGGRPAVEYVMPTVTHLCRDLGVTDFQGDALEAADLVNPTAYRLAMQRALIQRRPGSYSRKWLGRRIGVSKWTLRRYDRALGLDVRPRYAMTPITWRNLDAELPDGEWPMGVFLQTADGRRFPPVRGLAARLLKRGLVVALCRQGGNVYVVREAETTQVTRVTDAQKHIPTDIDVGKPNAINEPVQADYVPKGVHYCADCITPTIHPEKPCKRCGSLERGWLAPEILADVERTKVVWSALWDAKHPQKGLSALTPMQTELVNRLRLAVQRAAGDETQWLSEKQARKLVTENPASRVEWALTLLGTRRDLRSPAGFAYAIITDQRNRRRKEQTGDLLTHLAQSPYLQYFANADQITAMYEAVSC